MTVRQSILRAARIVQLRLWLPRLMAARPLDRVLHAVTPAATREPSKHLDPELERAVHHATERLLRHNRWLKTTCLYRSLVRYALLREAGVAARFVMGVRSDGDGDDRDGGDLDGHAWIELDGRTLFEELRHTYARTFSYPNEEAR